MQLRWKQAGGAVCSQNQMKRLTALGELYDFVQFFPCTAEEKVRGNKCNLVGGNGLPLQTLNFLVLNQKLPHYAFTSFQM